MKSLVDKAQMATWLGKSAAEFAQLEAEGLPSHLVEVAGIEVRRYESAEVIDWWIARQVRRATAH